MTTRLRAAAAALAALTLLAVPSRGDEGMWLFSNPPLKMLKEKHNFEPPAGWMDHLQKSCVRFPGGSGSFVSPAGLVMTNHHVGSGSLQDLSEIDKVDYLKLGFAAKTKAEEKKCPKLELVTLQSIKDVTAEVNAAVTPEMAPTDAVKARQQKTTEIEKAASDEPKGVRGDVVTLFAGGLYHLYTYKKYTDVRLVFAPEKQIAFFGGDPDNFEYPRYDLDMTFFRVYENDKPLKSEHFLTWSKDGSKENELVFVAGHPGRTNRQNTVAELEYLRDTSYPAQLQRLNRLEVLIGSWVGRSEENRKKGESDLFGIQNSRKARVGALQGLLDPKLMAGKQAEEKRLKDFIVNIGQTSKPAPVWFADASKAFETIAAAEKKRGELAKEFNFTEGAGGFSTQLFGYARALMRYADESKKDAKDRLPEFGDSRLPALKRSLFSPVPIDDEYETLKLSDSLTFLATTYGADAEFVKAVLAGKSPRERAFELVSGTKVKDLAVRTKGFESKNTPDADPMVALAKLVDAQARAVRKKFEAEVEEPKRKAAGALAQARFALNGANAYPDATFTLRLSVGTVAGYKENGKDVPAFTDIAGLYARSRDQGNSGPFELPKRWEDRKTQVDMKVPFNFVSNNDIIGGNSGSPCVNAKGEVVGLIFDGNIQSLVWDIAFDQREARSVHVDSRGMIEAMRKVYDAAWLADEIQGTVKK